MTQPLKYLLKTLGATAGAAAIYHLSYQRRFPLINEPQAEILLNESIEPVSYQTITEKMDWVLEDDYEGSMDQYVIPFIKEYLTEATITRGDYTLHYHLYQLKNPIATVVLVHGFNEYKEKFQEFIYYLLQHNIQVVVYDARGHGFSKISPQQTQIDAHDFMVYVDDLHAIIQQAVEPNLRGSKLILFGHSMGGAVVTDFAEEYPQLADGLILNTPMFLIDTGRYPQSFTFLYASLMSKIGYSNLYIPTTQAYQPELHDEHDPLESISGSIVRDAYYHQTNVFIHKIPTRGGSLGWLRAAFQMMHQVLNPDNLAKITQPVLLIRAGQDNVVQPEGIYTAGRYLPNVERVLMPESKHQTYLDQDKVIQPYYTKLIEFIQSV